MKLLIDTNIILDACQAREPWNKTAEMIILACAEEKVAGCITASSVTDIYYILKKDLRSADQTKQTLLKLLALLDVLDVTHADCEKAFELPMSDYDDALLACCGKRHKVDLIVTRNPKHFEGSPVKVVSPDMLLSIQLTENGYPMEFEAEIISASEESHAAVANGAKTYMSTAELRAALDAEEDDER
jgi:predicted nucleic acid-binding protein